MLAAWQGLLTTLSHAAGIYYPPAALFAVAFLFVLALLLHFSIVLSRLSDQNKILAQRVALLQQRLDEKESAETAEEEERQLFTSPAEPLDRDPEGAVTRDA